MLCLGGCKAVPSILIPAAANGVKLKNLVCGALRRPASQADFRSTRRCTQWTLIVSNGGFGLVVLDLGDIRPQLAQRIPLHQWYRLPPCRGIHQLVPGCRRATAICEILCGAGDYLAELCFGMEDRSQSDGRAEITELGFTASRK